MTWAICALTILGMAQTLAAETLEAASGEAAIAFAIGGTGGAYFLAKPGELVVDLEKRDRHVRDVRTDLRAILVGPERQVLQDVTIPDDGQAKGSGLGPAQRVRLSAAVERPGVYGLNITVSNDRYGDEILWGFRTNCPHYLIETARGHRDERRKEPIVLMKPDAPGDVCFLPRKDAFGVEVTGLPDDATPLTMYDGDGETIATIAVEPGGRAKHTFAADASREAVPWRLHLPKQQGIVQIDGVTRWESGDRYDDLPLWTPDPKSYFPFLPYRWLLTPYSRNVFGAPAEEKTIAFNVRNGADAPKTVALALEFPGDAWPVRLSAEVVTVGPGETVPVNVACAMPADGETRVCHIRATPQEDPAFSTYATLRATGGVAPAAQPLEIPLVLKPYEHENEQFGYLPDYPVDWEMYFDPQNRPWTATPNGIATLRDGQWAISDFASAVVAREPAFEGTFRGIGTSNTKIAFDRDGGVYMVASFGAQAALLHSNDDGRTFTAYGLGPSGGLDIEQFSGHNPLEGPPPVLRSIQTAADPDRIWRRLCDLDLFVPRKENGRIVVGDPVRVSKQCLGVGSHSGVPSAVVSRGTKVHVIWAEATDPKENVPGVPTYVATYDRETGALGEPVLVGYGAPPNDVHNRPCMTMDSKGCLHVLTGTHGAPFQYARSLAPNDANAGWTPAEPAGQDLPQTYIGMVCGPDDTLHIAYRLWRHDADRFPSGAIFATLACQRKPPDGPWEPPRILIVPPFSEYSVFYHRLTIDRQGRLFLSYDYWSTYWFYRMDRFGDRRALIMSPDAGNTWKLAEAKDLRR